MENNLIIQNDLKTHIRSLTGIFTDDGFYVSIDAVLGAIDFAQTIDAEPVQHGRWRHLGGDEWCCTVCGEVIYTEGSWEKPTHKYCNECGAKMDKGVQNDQN